jgi:hypothetical protein
MAKEPDLECKSHPENVGFVVKSVIPTMAALSYKRTNGLQWLEGLLSTESTQSGRLRYIICRRKIPRMYGYTRQLKRQDIDLYGNPAVFNSAYSESVLYRPILST